MTYCTGILVEQGLVMIGDTRTNAGLDNVSTFRKLNTFTVPGERVLMLATAGNLSVSQSVYSLLTEGLENPSLGEVETLAEGPDPLSRRAAHRARHPACARHRRQGAGGREAPLRRVVPLRRPDQGRAHAALHDLCRGQLHRMRAGRAVPADRRAQIRQADLDRAVTYRTELYDALKIGLISMDSTMRSNLGVGLPIDIAVLRRDTLEPEVSHRIEAGEPYFHDLRERWSAALRAAHIAIPRPPYGPTV
jgi:putative proteasome-type protease